MNLSKKQVKALLEVISSDDARPVLTTASIQEYEGKMYLVATDSYKLAAINITIDTGATNQYITREDLIKWYKLANARDNFTENDLMLLLQPKVDNYPKWQNLLPSETDEPQQISKLSINPGYYTTLNNLAYTSLVFTLYANYKYVAKTQNNIFVLMGLKI